MFSLEHRLAGASTQDEHFEKGFWDYKITARSKCENSQKYSEERRRKKKKKEKKVEEKNLSFFHSLFFFSHPPSNNFRVEISQSVLVDQ